MALGCRRAARTSSSRSMPRSRTRATWTSTPSAPTPRGF